MNVISSCYVHKTKGIHLLCYMQKKVSKIYNFLHLNSIKTVVL